MPTPFSFAPVQRMRRLALVAGLFAGLAAGLLAAGPAAHAQSSPRIGVGVQALGSTADENVGPGLRLRASAPINQDLSFAVGTGVTGFIFEGRDEASYSFDPQASLIVTLPVSGDQGLYFLGGAGAYLPVGETSADSGPTFHFGVGKVWLLRESSLFLEFDPAILVGEQETDVLFPLRLGVIF
jgi:hypothetical protein